MTPAQAIEITLQKFVTRPAPERLAILEKVRFAAGEVDGMGSTIGHDKEFAKALLPRLEQADKALTQAQRGEVRPTMPTWKETAQAAAWIVKPLALLAVLVGGCALFVAFISGAMVAVRLWAIEYGAWIGAGVGLLFVGALASALPNPFRERDESEPGEVETKNQTIINVYSATGGDIFVDKK